MPSKTVRVIKMGIFCALGIYATFTMFLAAAKTFGKAPNFAIIKPTDRCIGWFDTAQEFGTLNNNTLVAYALNAGRYRIGFCTDASNAVLDAKFGESLLFDPLSDATGGKCSLNDTSLTVQRETQCTISGMPAGTTCQSILATNPRPYGVAWKFTITGIGNASNAVPPAPPNATTSAPTTLAPAAALKCGANYAFDSDMPPCPYSNVRFYGKENKAISIIFILASLSSILLWFWEIVNVVQFANYHGERYGDLAMVVVPNDGTWGAIYAFYRVYVSGEPLPGDDPEMSWFQFFRSGLNQVLAQVVALIGVVGCNASQNAIMLALFLLTTIKLVAMLGKKAYTIIKQPKPTAQEIIDNAGDVPNPPIIDPNLSSLVADCVRRGADKAYMVQATPRIESSPSKNLYKKCLLKLLTVGPSCVQPEIARLTVICQRETTDPAIYNECISWIQLLEQCENFAAGGPGTYGPPRFPNWSTKAAPELAAARAAVEKGDGDDRLDEAMLARVVASPPSSPMNMNQHHQQQQQFQQQPQMQQSMPMPMPTQMAMPMPMPMPMQQQPPSLSFADFEPVLLNPQMQMSFATYGPATAPMGQGTNVTVQLQQLAVQYQGQAIQGGIHNLLGDVAPGVAKQLRVWYAGGSMINNNNNGYAPPQSNATMMMMNNNNNMDMLL